MRVWEIPPFLKLKRTVKPESVVEERGIDLETVRWRKGAVNPPTMKKDKAGNPSRGRGPHRLESQPRRWPPGKRTPRARD